MAKKKETQEDPVSNSPNSQSTADELRSFIERWESLEKDKKAITDDQKEIMAEAKGRGYDTKVMRRVIAERKRDAAEIEEEESVLELYRMALKMGAYAGEDEDDETGMV
jgi:uncharacterized protein (UPF0335 family)